MMKYISEYLDFFILKVKRNETGFTAGLKSAVSKLKTVDVKSHSEKFIQLVTTYSTILNKDSTKDVSQTKKVSILVF